MFKNIYEMAFIKSIFGSGSLDSSPTSAVNRSSYIALAIFTVAICFSHIHQGTLAVDAIRYAHIAKSILVFNNWFELYDVLYERPYVNKPPLLFWNLAVFFDAFGYSTFVAKFPAALFAALAIIFIGTLAARYFGMCAGLWAAIFFVVNTNFMRSVLDLNFESLIACGGLLCLAALMRFCRSFENSREPKTSIRLDGNIPSFKPALMHGFWFGLGILFLLQSKPPYVAIVLGSCILFAVLMMYRGESLPWLNFMLGACFPTLIGLAWFIYQGETYVADALANQIGLPLEKSDPLPKHLLLWIFSLYRNYTLAAIFGTLAIFRLIRSKQRISGMELLLVCFAAPIPLIMFSVDIRPRYIMVPMLGLMVLGGVEASRVLKKFSENFLRTGLYFISILVPILFGLFNLPIHRSDPFITLAFQRPELISQATFCLDQAKPEKSEAKIKMARLLFDLEFNQKPKIYTSQAILNLPGHLIVANAECAKALELNNTPYHYKTK